MKKALKTSGPTFLQAPEKSVISTILSSIFAQIVDYFHSFVRPKLNPQLTEFCLKATGVGQKQVDEAPDFIRVLKTFRGWLSSRKYFKRYLMIKG